MACGLVFDNSIKLAIAIVTAVASEGTIGTGTAIKLFLQELKVAIQTGKLVWQVISIEQLNNVIAFLKYLKRDLEIAQKHVTESIGIYDTVITTADSVCNMIAEMKAKADEIAIASNLGQITLSDEQVKNSAAGWDQVYHATNSFIAMVNAHKEFS